MHAPFTRPRAAGFHLPRIPGAHLGSAGKGHRILLLAGLLIVAGLAGSWLAGEMRLHVGTGARGMADWTIPAVLVAYIAAMATPFVPGVEIGLALMAVLGRDGIVLVYLATQVALATSFLAGRALPPHALATLFGWLRLERARRLVEEIGAAPAAERMAVLTARLPAGAFGPIARHPCLALALALNMPGNGIIGGAGGIAMIAGMSRACGLRCYLLIVAAATMPAPLLLFLWGAN